MMPRFSLDNPWRVLWQMATSDYLLGATLLVLAVSLLLAAWLPQTTLQNSTQDVAWRSELQRRFGDITWFDTIRAPLQTLGAFHVADAPGFRLVLGLLAIALLARLVDSIEAVWQALRHDKTSEAMSREGQHEKREDTRDTDLHFWADLGSMGIYLGGLMILLGAAITNAWGWRTASLALAPGQSAPLDQGSDLRLRLDSLAEDGQRGRGEIWRGEETLISAGTLAVGQPLEGSGVGAYLVGSGKGLRVQATLPDTQILELETGPDATAQGELAVAFTERESRHLVGVPEADLVLLLKMPERDQTNESLYVQVFEAGTGEFLLEQEVTENTNMGVRDVTISLTPVAYAEIQAVRDQGAFWSQLGVIGLVAGMLLQGFEPLRRAWHQRSAVADRLTGGVDPDHTAETPISGADLSRANGA